MPFMWTPQEDDMLKALVGAKKNIDEIRTVLVGRSENAIRHHMHYKGLKCPSTEINFEAFKKLMKG